MKVKGWAHTAIYTREWRDRPPLLFVRGSEGIGPHCYLYAHRPGLSCRSHGSSVPPHADTDLSQLSSRPCSRQVFLVAAFAPSLSLSLPYAATAVKGQDMSVLSTNQARWRNLSPQQMDQSDYANMFASDGMVGQNRGCPAAVNLPTMHTQTQLLVSYWTSRLAQRTVTSGRLNHSYCTAGRDASHQNTSKKLAHGYSYNTVNSKHNEDETVNN